MLRIEPTTKLTSFKASDNSSSDSKKPEHKESDKAMITGTLAGLAAIGAAVIGLKKTAPTTYENALKKAGVQVKDGIATLIESGEKYTGRIERFEKRNRKETVEFVDGVITEKVYHSLTGKELRGEFYKDGKRVLRIWRSAGQMKNSYGFSYITSDASSYSKPAPFIKTNEGFAWARNYIKNNG